MVKSKVSKYTRKEIRECLEKRLQKEKNEQIIAEIYKEAEKHGVKFLNYGKNTLALKVFERLYC